MSAFIHVSGFGEPSDIAFVQAWIADEDRLCVSVSLAEHASVTLHSIAEADALVAAAADAKAAMQALRDGKHAWRCRQCKALIIADDEPPAGRRCPACSPPPPDAPAEGGEPGA